MNKETAVTGIEMLRAKGLLEDVDVNDPKFLLMAIIDQMIPDKTITETKKLAKSFEGSIWNVEQIMDAYINMKVKRLLHLITSDEMTRQQLKSRMEQ